MVCVTVETEQIAMKEVDKSDEQIKRTIKYVLTSYYVFLTECQPMRSAECGALSLRN